MIVSREFRGRGIGRQLMAEIERIGRERNCSYIMFVSGVKRKEAHRFLKRWGMVLMKYRGLRSI